MTKKRDSFINKYIPTIHYLTLYESCFDKAVKEQQEHVNSFNRDYITIILQKRSYELYENIETAAINVLKIRELIH